MFARLFEYQSIFRIAKKHFGCKLFFRIPESCDNLFVKSRSPEERPELRMVTGGAVDLAVWEWPGQGPPLVLAHATAFHGRLWDAVVRLLPGRRALAIDARSHGRSGRVPPPAHWQAFGADLARVIDRFALRDAVAVGHSMGGHALVQSAALRPSAFATWLLIDPTIYPEERYSEPPLDGSFTLRRKARFDSVEQMFERFRHRPPFARWRPEILHDYCQFGLLAARDGLVLACPPAFEASIYAESTAPEANLYPVIADIAAPVVVMRAGMERKPGALDLSASPTAPDLASRFARGRDILLPGRSHYIPMEDPDAVAKEIRRLG
jgi:pimeloyl-ACP methyl ester carboxylesterase